MSLEKTPLTVRRMASRDAVTYDATSEDQDAVSLPEHAELAKDSGSSTVHQSPFWKKTVSTAPLARRASDLSVSTNDESPNSLNSSYELITEDEVISSKWPGYGNLVESPGGVQIDGRTQRSYRPRGMPDPEALTELEAQAGQIADSLSHMLGNMHASLQAMSGRTLMCTEAYRDSIERIGGVVDENIKLMYTLTTKCDNINYSMKFIAAIADQIKSIKQTLTIFEEMCK